MRLHRMGGISLVFALAFLTLGPVGTVSAAGNTFKIEPASTTVAKDATFEVKVVQNASVPVSGAQATITFDKAKVQVTTVTRGAPYASAPLFLAGDAAAISAANKSGKLKTVAAAFLPPDSVPAGSAEFLIVGFKATACGAVKLGLPVGLADAAMNDGREKTYGKALKVTTTPGVVTVSCPGDAPAATSAPAASGDLASAPAPSGDVLGESSPPDTAGASPDSLAQPSPEATMPASAPVSSTASSPSPAPAGDASAATAAQQDAWLTFAMAALAIAAIGLALMIVVVVTGLLIGSIVGLIMLVRMYRRPAVPPQSGAAASGGGGPADGDPTPTGSDSDREPDGTGDAAGALAAAAPDQPGPGPDQAADR